MPNGPPLLPPALVSGAVGSDTAEAARKYRIGTLRLPVKLPSVIVIYLKREEIATADT